MNLPSKKIALFLAIMTVLSASFLTWAVIDPNNLSQSLEEWNKQNTELALSDIAYINATIIEPNPKEDIFYWLFTSTTIQLSEGQFVMLAKNLGVKEIFYKTDNDWNSQFAFYINGTSNFDDITILYFVNGTTWRWK